MLEKTQVAAVLLEYKQEGMDAEAIARHIKRRFPDLPIILPSAYTAMPERILWLMDDSVMKSEFPERLLPTIEGGHNVAPFGTDGCNASMQQRENLDCPVFVAMCSMLFRGGNKGNSKWRFSQ
jgi:CheY-like chemotaxis protein